MSDMAVEIEPRKITVSEFHRMGEAGIFAAGERVELLDGVLVQMSPIGRPHRALHAAIVGYLIETLASRAVVLGQSGLQLGRFSEPEPDVLVFPPDPAGAYYTSDPEPSDVYAVIEIADTSLAKDLHVKRELYGRFSIPDYLVIDVRGRVVLHFSDPSATGYADPRTLRAGDTLRLRAVPETALDVARFLPPAGVPLGEPEP